jgi:hypothetical protein
MLKISALTVFAACLAAAPAAAAEVRGMVNAQGTKLVSKGKTIEVFHTGKQEPALFAVDLGGYKNANVILVCTQPEDSDTFYGCKQIARFVATKPKP